MYDQSTGVVLLHHKSFIITRCCSEIQQVLTVLLQAAGPRPNVYNKLLKHLGDKVHAVFTEKGKTTGNVAVNLMSLLNVSKRCFKLLF